MREKTTTTTKSLLRRGGARIAYCMAAVLSALLLPAQAMADDEAWAEFNSGTKTLTFKYGSKPESFGEGITAYALNTGTYRPMWNNNNGIEKAVFDPSFAEARPTSCYSWFEGCKNLTEITGLEYLNTEEATDISDMFHLCYALKSLDLSGFNTAKVEDMSMMFTDCWTLESVTFSPSFNTEKVTDMYKMFYWCENLKSLDLSGFNTANVEDMNQMFFNCNSLESITLSSNFNTSKVTGMEEMFLDCSELQSLDLSSFNTENVTTMESMFDGCSVLESITFPATFTTANVENMRYMFAGCSGLKTLDLTNFNTEKVTTMESMFDGCSVLESITFPASFNTANVTDMYYMFNYCESLQSLDLSGFSTGNVTDMNTMFQGCSELTGITGLEKFNTANVESTSSMFSGCSKLTSLDLSNFNTEKVEGMGSMFQNCSSLTSLDLTSFNTEKVTDMGNMFDGCSSLTTIYVSDKFVTDAVTTSGYMFNDCSTSLVGATTWSDGNTDEATMANYNTGYFKTYCRVGDTKHDLSGETLSVENLVLEDGKDFVAHAPFTAATASYTRTMANKWGTLCLPFALETSTVTGCTFYGLESVADDLITLTLLDGTIEAGTPVFVNSSNGSISISASNAAVVTTPAAGTESGWQLVGSYTVTDVPDDGYIISKGKFWLASELKNGSTDAAVKTKGLRAWLKAGTTGDEARANTLDIFAGDAGDAATSIDAMDALADGTAEIYDTQGRRTDRLQKGLNIVKTGGATRKVMVK